MRIEQLEEFIALYETLSFTKAAKALHESQSMLSRHLQSMEAELGHVLFDRDRHHVAPTHAGRVLYRETRTLVLGYHKALKAIGRVRAPLSEQVRIGYLSSATKPFLKDALDLYSKRHRKPKVLLYELEYNESFDELCSGKVDFLFSLSPAGHEDDALIIEPLYEDAMCLCMRSTHRYANRESIALKELKGIRFKMLNFDRTSTLSKEISRTLAHVGIRDVSTIDVPDAASIPLVAAPQGSATATFMSSHLRNLFANDDDLRFVPIEMQCAVYVSAVWKRDNDCAELRDLASCAREALALREPPDTSCGQVS